MKVVAHNAGRHVARVQPAVDAEGVDVRTGETGGAGKVTEVGAGSEGSGRGASNCKRVGS